MRRFTNLNGICRDRSSSIDSMVELLQGRVSKAVIDRVCRLGDGLFHVVMSGQARKINTVQSLV
jgi:hypothetical protein